MKKEYNNLYTHFVFTTLNRLPNIINKPYKKIQRNEVIRLKEAWLHSFATEVVLLFLNEVKMRLSYLCLSILSTKQANPAADTAALEREIDGLVYGLYELTEEEIAVIEKQ